MHIYHACFFSFFTWSLKMQEPEDITPIDTYVVEFVKALRKKKELSQQNIADYIGAHRTFVTNAENGKQRAKYNLTHINTLAFYLDMSPQDFLPKVAIDPKTGEKK